MNKERNYYKINFNPDDRKNKNGIIKGWNFYEELKVGEWAFQNYRSNLKEFEKCNVGDILIAYSSGNLKEISGICIILDNFIEDKNFIFKKLKEFSNPVKLEDFKHLISKSKIGMGTLFKLEEEEVESLIKILEEKNPDFKFVDLDLENLEYEKNQEGENKMINDLVKKLEQSKNIILRGAPGTGKTFMAKKVAASLVGISEYELDNSEQYAFVQFHPSYDYTDFVEGIRAIKNDNNDDIAFELKDGIFKKFCEKAKKSKIINEVDNFDEAWEKLIQEINENDNYKIKGSESPVTLNTKGNIKFKSPVATKETVYKLYKKELTKLKYETYQKIVLNHLKENFDLKDYKAGDSNNEDNKKYVFVIDEINRGEISKIFGELFFSIDPGYRGEKGGVLTQYSNLHEDEKEKFYVPDNVYIIGTMNDIDRSVDSLDFAMRRRFRFIEITAEDSKVMLDDNLDKDKVEETKNRLTNLNNAISEIGDLNENYHIGASYFLKLKELDYSYEILWEDYIEPLLEEYLRGAYGEKDNLEKLKKAYNKKEEEVDE